MAVVSNISIYEGEDVVLSFAPSTAQGTTNITGWTIVFSLATDHEDATTKTTINGEITVAASGTFTVTLTSAQTDIAAGKYVWDVRRTNSGAETVLAEGTLTIKAGVRL